MWVDFLTRYKTNSIFTRDSPASHRETPRNRFNKQLPSLHDALEVTDTACKVVDLGRPAYNILRMIADRHVYAKRIW